jgi:hypothetical protein
MHHKHRGRKHKEMTDEEVPYIDPLLGTPAPISHSKQEPVHQYHASKVSAKATEVKEKAKQTVRQVEAKASELATEAKEKIQEMPSKPSQPRVGFTGGQHVITQPTEGTYVDPLFREHVVSGIMGLSDTSKAVTETQSTKGQRAQEKRATKQQAEGKQSSTYVDPLFREHVVSGIMGLSDTSKDEAPVIEGSTEDRKAMLQAKADADLRHPISEIPVTKDTVILQGADTPNQRPAVAEPIRDTKHHPERQPTKQAASSH